MSTTAQLKNMKKKKHMSSTTVWNKTTKKKKTENEFMTAKEDSHYKADKVTIFNCNKDCNYFILGLFFGIFQQFYHFWDFFYEIWDILRRIFAQTFLVKFMKTTNWSL